ncbi:twin-arginine translocation pathway signal protein [Altericroceibacterium spongiae]|uniref:Twin-arginine translocation pathway signal protein n=1 Tax=Altericroceibacterium spongiae TaxID=2320269 RepID=A0A420EMA6_9SPHN|nr:sulfatase-like hydrolase/transferase [Altericroceibacterium spongiae]RKF21847.1 twin-arginine translocation pathway signal protein [Altericroceibacterium spongiae]
MASGPFSITRRHAVSGALSTAALAAASPVFSARPGNRPNILFIMADDLGYADLSCYGRAEYETPVLDGLARDGMKCTHAYANSAVCTATRVALITGRYQYRTPIGLEEPLGLRDVGLEPGHPTIASLLRNQGYRTSLIGKWHMGSLPKYGPLKSGYDEFWGIRSGGVDYFTHASFGRPDLWDGTTPIEETGYLTELLAERTMDTLDRRAEDHQPFFISLHLTAPHWPWEGPEDKAESDRLARSENPAAMMDYDGGDMDTYAAMVTSMDRQIGRVLDRLEQLGLADNTVVVFTSDNGGERFSDTWPFTGKKTELLEGGLRIPLIVRWPGLTTPGSESDVPVISMDWLPTFLAAAGGAPDPAYPTDGIDIRPALRGASLPDRTLFWRFSNHGQQAARHGRYKYLQIAGNSFLFDVVADPLERANLKDRDPARYDNLKKAWAAWDETMLHDPTAPSYGFTGKALADHFGVDS